MIDVDLLDGDVRKRDAEAQRAGPPKVWEASQGCAIGDYHQYLAAKDRCEHVPHVYHLLRRNLGEEERQVLRHGVWLVRGREQPIGLQTPVFVVFLNREHLVAALRNACCIWVSFTRQCVFESGDLVIMPILNLEP